MKCPQHALATLVAVAALAWLPYTASRAQSGIQRSVSSAAPLPAGVATAIPFDVTQVNVGGFVAASGVLGTVQQTGVHTIAGALHLDYAGTSASNVSGTLRINGAAVETFVQTLSPNTANEIPIHRVAPLNPGDVVTVEMLANVPGVSIGTSTNASLTNFPGSEGSEAYLAVDKQLIPSFNERVFDNFGYTGAGLGTVASILSVTNPDEQDRQVTARIIKFFDVFEETVEIVQIHVPPKSSNQIQVAGLAVGANSLGLDVFTTGSQVTVEMEHSNASVLRAPGGMGLLRRAGSTVTLTPGQYLTVPFNATFVNVGGFQAAANQLGVAKIAGMYVIGGELELDFGSGGSTFVSGEILADGQVIDTFSKTHPIDDGNFQIPLYTLANLNANSVVTIRVLTNNSNVELRNSSRVFMMTARIPEPTGTALAFAGATMVAASKCRRRRPAGA